MDNLLLVILVIIFVFMCSQLMKNMCGQQLVEGIFGSSGNIKNKQASCGGNSKQCGTGCGAVLLSYNTIYDNDYNCIKCPAGKYSQSKLPNRGCDACPIKTTTPAGTTGASSISQCNACIGNYYKDGIDQNGVAKCKACPKGKPFSLSRSTSEDDCSKPDPRYCLPYIDLKREGKKDADIKKLLKDTVVRKPGNHYTLTQIGDDGQWKRVVAGWRKRDPHSIEWDDSIFTQFKEGNYCLNCLMPYYMTHDGKCGNSRGDICPVGGGWKGPTCSYRTNNKPVPRSVL